MQEATRAWPDDLPDSIDIALDPKPLPDDTRPEPGLASIPFLVEFDEPVRLDPERIGLLWELPPQTRHPIAPRSPAVSLLIHLLPLLTLVTWPHPTVDLPQPIPVQLVILEPPPEPAPQPPPQNQPGPLASADFGDTKPQPPNASAAAPPPPPPPVEDKKPEEEAQAAGPPPPKAPPRKPPPAKAAPTKPSPVRLLNPDAVPTRREDTRRPASRQARFAGPAASRDEYLAYLVTLTRRHLDLLPASAVGSRRGETVVSITVQDNGTISRISVAHSSGFPDLDERVERMVAAVGRFPPVPQWFQGSAMVVELTVHFPEAAEQ